MDDNSKKFDINNLKGFATGEDILKEIENRIAHLEKEEVNTEKEIKDVVNVTKPEVEFAPEIGTPTLFERIRPFILPLILTILALIFSFIFVFYFLNSREEPTVRAITATGNPEQLTPPPQKEIVVIEDKKPDVATDTTATDTQVVDNPPVIPSFENGTTTEIRVRFAYNKQDYDTHPNGIYLTGSQIFDGEYESYKILATNRSYANDFLFGVDRNKVNFLGTCTYKIDDATLKIENMTDSSNDKSYELIGKKYFRGKVVKVIRSSKPYVKCAPGQSEGEESY